MDGCDGGRATRGGDVTCCAVVCCGVVWCGVRSVLVVSRRLIFVVGLAQSERVEYFVRHRFKVFSSDWPDR